MCRKVLWDVRNALGEMDERVSATIVIEDEVEEIPSLGKKICVMYHTVPGTQIIDIDE